MALYHLTTKSKINQKRRIKMWQKTGTKKLGGGEFLELVAKKFLTPKGRKIIWECLRLSRNRDNVVMVIPITNEGEIVLVKQFRGPREKFVIEFPAGVCENGELLQKAALRELLEETGYKAGRLSKLFPTGPFAAGSIEHVFTFFLASNLKYAGKINSGDLAEKDNIEVLKVPFEEMENFLYGQVNSDNQNILEIDVKIWPMIYFLKEYFRKKRESI